MVSNEEKQLLRQLAARYREIADLPVMEQRKKQWRDFNGLRPQRPMVLCFPEGCWVELVTEDSLQCTDPLLRRWERHFRSKIFWWEKICDDNTIDPYFDIGWVVDEGHYGVEIAYTQGDHRGSHVWDWPIKNLDGDLDQLKFRQPRVDRTETQRQVELATELFGDLLPVRMRGLPWWTVGLTERAIKLVGLEPLMLYMYDNPAGMHRLMKFLSDDWMNYMTWYEREGLLTLRNESDYVGSGGVGHTDELPGEDWQEGDPVRLKDIWGFAESQETVGVSPEMFAEFILPYQLPLLEKTGLNCYGCCEPINQRLDYLIDQVANLRRVSVSPWADQEQTKQKLGNDYVFSRKPNPAMICASFDEQRITADLDKTLSIAGDGPLEIIMKDTHTVQYEPWRITRWVEIARQRVEIYLGG